MSDIVPPVVHATQPTFELHSLGWKAFQHLCVTVAGEIWGQVVQGFFDSHDGGRDGAFHGVWKPVSGEAFEGAFTVQCKFSQKAHQTLRLADIKDELAKATRLAVRGLADNYILFTNMQVTGIVEEKVRAAFESLPGIKRCAVYGGERICQFIRESPRLRMLVPRVYGLGDLSQIVDGRAYDQAQEILSAMGDDMAKFVITDAHRTAAKALVEHGFVLLLGEPACGKSAIAATLALGAWDEWNCFTIKARDADEVVRHSNPHEKQFFWVDDAFGATQLDWQGTLHWNAAFPHVRAAIKRGAKFVFTSRDYIYKSARNFLKESTLPVLHESQVIIQVEQLSKDEREQILYNHVRLGSHPQAFKRQIKSHLGAVAAHPRFSPEIARRLGNPAFTKKLQMTEAGLSDFVQRPMPLLQENIRTLDAGSRAAIALVFMRGGALTSPVALSSDEERAVVMLGASVPAFRQALPALEGSFLIRSQHKGQHLWRPKHPTILDAFAGLVAEDQELLDIYLAGTPIQKLFLEVSCGGERVDGAKVEVPADRYDAFSARITTFHAERWDNKNVVYHFLAFRCGAEFLKRFLELNPGFLSTLCVGAYFYAVADIDVINTAFKFGLLPESERERHVREVRSVAIRTPDSGFLKSHIIAFMTNDEVHDTLVQVREEFLPALGRQISDWRDNHTSDEDPESYFEPLKSALSDFADAFVDDVEALTLIDAALSEIKTTIKELQSSMPDARDPDDYYRGGTGRATASDSRSIFDDVDE